ncbi:MAG: prenyltransferase/squalene oxidase repeat-containing protein [Candidatus Heimdallarchaeota archaeon]
MNLARLAIRYKTYLQLCLFLVWIGLASAVPSAFGYTSSQMTSPVSNTNYQVGDLPNTDLGNSSFVGSILAFLQRSQDTATEKFPSMDYAYFIASSMKSLSGFEQIPYNLSGDVLPFVESARNVDGGYGNWEGARSSMESTFQALSILSIHDRVSHLNVTQVNQTLQYLENLKTPQDGYLPLLDWDAPDMSSTYRALWMKKELMKVFPTLDYGNDSNIISFITGNYNPPFFISGPAGYSEVEGGKTELLASFDALRIYRILNLENPNASNLAIFLGNLVSSSGGVAGLPGGLPTTGYTSLAIQMYLDLNNYTTFNLQTILSQSFIDNAVNYIRGNKLAGTGFASSERDQTAEIRSTHLALVALDLLSNSNFLETEIDFSGVYQLLIQGKSPSYGFGDYPGDPADLSNTAQAIIAAKLLGTPDPSWMHHGVQQFIEECYSNQGGFGFRPFTTPLIKNTYYGIRMERYLEKPLVMVSDIERFIIDSQNIDGGFGESPRALLSYLTHTYWAVSSLNLLGANNRYSYQEQVKNWLETNKNPDGTYSNFPGINSSIVSTYRAIRVRNLVEDHPNFDPLSATLLKFQTSSGGFVSSLDKALPSMDATFYGISLALELGLEINTTEILEFVLSLKNTDGGFAPREGYSSRVSSTYFASLILYLLNQSNVNDNDPIFSEDPIDYFAPIIRPAFVPSLDSNSTILGTYRTTARIIDPESDLNQTWIETQWSRGENLTLDSYLGIKEENIAQSWVFLLGPYNDEGILKFRIHAADNNGNEAVTPYYFLRTRSFVTGKTSVFDITPFLLSLLPIIFILLGCLDAGITYKRNQRIK